MGDPPLPKMFEAHPWPCVAVFGLVLVFVAFCIYVDKKKW